MGGEEGEEEDEDGLLGTLFGTAHFEVPILMGDLDPQMRLQGFQMGLHRAAQARQARIVERGEGVGQNQVDNPW